jgi:hypothetical protein
MSLAVLISFRSSRHLILRIGFHRLVCLLNAIEHLQKLFLCHLLCLFHDGFNVLGLLALHILKMLISSSCGCDRNHGGLFCLTETIDPAAGLLLDRVVEILVVVDKISTLWSVQVSDVA